MRRMWNLLKQGGSIIFAQVSACLLSRAVLCWVAPLPVMVQPGLALGWHLGSDLLPEDSFLAQAERPERSDGMLFSGQWQKDKREYAVLRHHISLDKAHHMTEPQVEEWGSTLLPWRRKAGSKYFWAAIWSTPGGTLNNVCVYILLPSTEAVSDSSKELKSFNAWPFNIYGQANKQNLE